MGKLTLSIDQETIDRAKRVARSRKTSLSSLVSQYFASLKPPVGEDAFLAGFHRKLEREGFEPSSRGENDWRDRHVSEKYR
ncbi:MAG: DUF6364 family protein [Acidobacteriota bacterium]